MGAYYPEAYSYTDKERDIRARHVSGFESPSQQGGHSSRSSPQASFPKPRLLHFLYHFLPVRLRCWPHAETVSAACARWFGLGKSSSCSAISQWEADLISTERVLELMLERMESDHLSLSPKMRKAWSAKDFAAWADAARTSFATELPAERPVGVCERGDRRYPEGVPLAAKLNVNIQHASRSHFAQKNEDRFNLLQQHCIALHLKSSSTTPFSGACQGASKLSIL